MEQPVLLQIGTMQSLLGAVAHFGWLHKDNAQTIHTRNWRDLGHHRWITVMICQAGGVFWLGDMNIDNEVLLGQLQP